MFTFDSIHQFLYILFPHQFCTFIYSLQFFHLFIRPNSFNPFLPNAPSKSPLLRPFPAFGQTLSPFVPSTHSIQSREGCCHGRPQKEAKKRKTRRAMGQTKTNKTGFPSHTKTPHIPLPTNGFGRAFCLLAILFFSFTFFFPN